VKFKLTDGAGKVQHMFEVTSGAPVEAPEVVIFPTCGGPFILAVRDDADGAQVYRPAKGVVEFPA